ncbi:type 1 glutamine amidotransferase domain-containing protein [Prosthecobacter fusiformis]|nr:type 1 glutamine amidotransferase domain-containing protein [Prosthecobacter fusiformis]
MKLPLDSRHVAILVTDGFEQSELELPLRALELAGAKVTIISPAAGEIQGMHHDEKGDLFDTDLRLDLADPEDFDALLLPGGLANPDTLRSLPAAVSFVREFGLQGKPIAAICHGPWILIEAGLVEGRRLTSWPAIQTDIRNAGGEWVDEEVVVDMKLVTSRQPDDIPAFNSKMIEVFSQGADIPLGVGAQPPLED